MEDYRLFIIKKQTMVVLNGSNRYIDTEDRFAEF